MPVVVSPGDVLGIYVHSAEEGDQGVVYDNQRNKTTCCDKFITITSGMADLSDKPFSDVNPWGSYSNSWRKHREFVGRISCVAVACKRGVAGVVCVRAGERGIEGGDGGQPRLRCSSACGDKHAGTERGRERGDVWT